MNITCSRSFKIIFAGWFRAVREHFFTKRFSVLLEARYPSDIDIEFGSSMLNWGNLALELPHIEVARAWDRELRLVLEPHRRGGAAAQHLLAAAVRPALMLAVTFSGIISSTQIFAKIHLFNATRRKRFSSRIRLSKAIILTPDWQTSQTIATLSTIAGRYLFQ